MLIVTGDLWFTDRLDGWTGKLRLAELITKLSEFERNIY